MKDLVLSPLELNRAVLARQLLLARSPLPLTRAVERVAGLQTQNALSGYIALWSRLRRFDRASYTMALRRRRLVQATLMRVTIHTVSAGDYPLFAAGVRRARRAWWLRTFRQDPGRLDMDAVARRVRSHLATGPRRADDIKEFLRAGGAPDVAWSGVGLWLDLVRVPPSGTWERRRADLYGLAETWLPAAHPSEREGLEHLVRRYLGGFGPAPVRDIANWAGVPVTTLRPVVEALPLRRLRDEAGSRLVDLRGASIPDGDAPAPVRFLPTWEPSLLAHARRARILPEEYRPAVFDTASPQSVCTFLVDGSVAGVWRHEERRIRLEPFAPLPRVARRELEAEAAALAAFYEG